MAFTDPVNIKIHGDRWTGKTTLAAILSRFFKQFDGVEVKYVSQTNELGKHFNKLVLSDKLLALAPKTIVIEDLGEVTQIQRDARARVEMLPYTVQSLKEEVVRLKSSNNRLRARLSALRVERNSTTKAATRAKRAALRARTHKSLSVR